MNLLLIDDDRDYNFLIQPVLKKSGIVENFYIVDEARKVKNFIDCHSGNLDCIFIDIRMPEMDGFEFLKKHEMDVRKKFPDVRVYFLTSSIRDGDLKKALASYSVEGVYTKPLTYDILQEIKQELKKI